MRALSQVVPDFGSEEMIISVSCGLKPLWKLRIPSRVLLSYQYDWYLNNLVPLKSMSEGSEEIKLMVS